MSATVTQLGARVLRKIGVVIVPTANQPAPGAIVPLIDLGARVLRACGVSFIATGDRLAAGATFGPADIAANVLRDFDIVTTEAERPALSVTIAQSEIAARALRAVGVNPFGPAAAPSSETTYTLDQVATFSLQHLGVISATETATSQDQALMLTKVGAAHETVTRLDIAAWLGSAIPARALPYYITMAAALGAASFGPRAEAATFAGAYEVAERKLLQIALSGVDGQNLAMAKVAAVHDALIAQGLVYWALNAIPQAFTEEYVVLTSELLAVVMGHVSDKRSSVTTVGVGVDAQNRTIDMKASEAAVARIKQAGIIRNAYARALSQVAQVHEEINATGLAQWPVTAIPQSVADAYQDLVTQNMGLSFGRAPVDQEANQSAWTRLRRLALSTPKGQLIAQQKVAEAQDAVAAQALAFWTIDTVPLSVAPDLVAMAAILLLPVVTGQPSDPAVTQPVWDAAKEHIRKVCMLQTAQSLAEGKILAVHADLDVRGVIRWTIFDIPDYAEEPYVAMAAFLIAPEFGVQVDPNMWGGAKKALARAVSVPAGREPIRMDAF